VKANNESQSNVEHICISPSIDSRYLPTWVVMMTQTQKQKPIYL